MSGYALNSNILECHKDCATCAKLSKNGCTSCKDEKLLWNGECISECPSGFYLESFECLPCLPPCTNCTSPTVCTACPPNFYKSGDECIFFESCPKGTYNDSLECKACSKACLGCSGPTDSDCIDCNYAKGYIRGDTNSKECHLLVCSAGTYLAVNEIAKLFSCQPCHESCETCSSSLNCIECKKGYMKLNKSPSEESLCATCPGGYKTMADGTCEGKGIYEE